MAFLLNHADPSLKSVVARIPNYHYCLTFLRRIPDHKFAMNPVCIACGRSDLRIASRGQCLNCASREWRKNNPEKARQSRKTYRKEQSQSWARRVRLGGDGNERKGISVAHLMTLEDNHPNCPSCGCRLDYSTAVGGDDKATLDRVIPSLGYIAGNVMPLCARENRLKQNAAPDDWHRLIAYVEKYAPSAFVAAALREEQGRESLVAESGDDANHDDIDPPSPETRLRAGLDHLRWVDGL